MRTDVLKRSAMGSSGGGGEAEDAGTGSGHLHITFDIWDSRRKHDGQSYVVFFTRLVYRVGWLVGWLGT